MATEPDDAPVAYSVRDEGDQVVMTIHGDIDLRSSADIRAAIGEAARPDAELIIDLAGVRFLDSSGLGALVWARRRMQREGGDVVVVRPRRNVRRMLEVSGLSKVVPVEGMNPPGQQ